MTRHPGIGYSSTRPLRPLGLDRPCDAVFLDPRLNLDLHASLLSVELRPVESSFIDIGHAQQPQEPALEPAELGCEDYRRSLAHL